MSKAVLTSIRPKYCNLIVYGHKLYEVRKTRPNLNTPFTSFIYCTKGTGVNTFNVPISNKKLLEHFLETDSMKSLNYPIGNGKVIGRFICDEIVPWHEDYAPPVPLELTGLLYSSIRQYWGDKETIYLWHISELKIYDEPKELSEFEKPCPYNYDCWKCKYYFNGSFDEPPHCDLEDFGVIERPPQSWCYVEELQ